jgi:hypothetical protein
MNADFFESDEINMCANLAQIAHCAVIIDCVIGRFAGYDYDWNVDQVGKSPCRLRLEPAGIRDWASRLRSANRKRLPGYGSTGSRARSDQEAPRPRSARVFESRYCWLVTAARIATRDDILFVGDVGEEGPGDLRGMKYLFKKGKYAGRITQFISIEQGSDGGITVGGTGSRRYELTFTGPGGHSYEDFGMVNPAVAMAGTIMKMLAANTPDSPKTTWNFGVFSGGTSVNTIPSSLTVAVDLRSEDAGELERLDKYLIASVEGAVKEENGRHSTAAGAGL